MPGQLRTLAILLNKGWEALMSQHQLSSLGDNYTMRDDLKLDFVDQSC